MALKTNIWRDVMFYRIHQKCLNAKVVPQAERQACQIPVTAQPAGGNFAVTDLPATRNPSKSPYCRPRRARTSMVVVDAESAPIFQCDTDSL